MQIKKTNKRVLGTVFLVGAGPGDAGLLTLRGAELLRTADAVVYDWLVNPRLLDLAPRAQKIYVGKNIKGKKIGRYIPQNEINARLVELAQSGKRVVRLKGGDPFIFGRGGEEASYLKRQKIPFEIVPGVSAASGVPAYAGIPVTDRRFASQVVFITGHEDPKKSESRLDWKWLAQNKGTLVSFMGMKNLPSMVKNLKDGGMRPQTPVSIVEWGTLPQQRVCEGTLATIAKKTKKMKIESPALAVIGQVNRLRKQLSWFEQKPLFGKRVLVTRARAQASSLRVELEKLGAGVLELPTIEILPLQDFRPLDAVLQNLNRFDWIIFTSVNAVATLRDRLRHLEKDSRALSSLRIAAIGEVTEGALKEMGILPDFVPSSFTSQVLGQELQRKGWIRGQHFLLPRTDIAGDELRKYLESKGGRVTEVVAYRTVAAPPEGWANGEKKKLEKELLNGTLDFITLTSSSTVKNFFDLISKKVRRKIKSRFISIGPMTSSTLKKYGYKPAKEANPHTLAGLIESLKSKRYQVPFRKKEPGTFWSDPKT